MRKREDNKEVKNQPRSGVEGEAPSGFAGGGGDASPYKEEGPPETEDEITQVLPEESLEAEKEVPDEEVSALKEMEGKYLRAYADFENYRKRVAKEKEEVVSLATQRLLREFLEVKDHLEMALAHSEESTDVKGLREGVTLTLKQLNNFLEKMEVQEISALGEPFDPAYHEAIHQEESVEYPPGVVVHVYQKGYLLRGKLLRAARVTVAAEKKGQG